ncbi:MAG: hypothetical protein HDT26_00925 [Subdoligranulum sp.]|nr:hypothetical protein [Subdoligranulum sp.]
MAALWAVAFGILIGVLWGQVRAGLFVHKTPSCCEYCRRHPADDCADLIFAYSVPEGTLEETKKELQGRGHLLEMQ